MSDDQHDAVIMIGTGAGSGACAHRITSGKRVLLLERGDSDSTAVFVQGTRVTPEHAQ